MPAYEVLYSPLFREHKPEEYHPENPSRLDYAIEGLKANDLWKNIREPEEATPNDLLGVHERPYVARVRELSKSSGNLDPDTYVSPGTWNAALKAFGASREAALSAMERKGLYLALVRPPGHHSGRNGKAFNAPTLGFCIFNNIAGAAKLVEALDGKAVIIDFDAHHGNGTQEIFWNDPNVIHIDIHKTDIYPWSGHEHEVGGRDAKGTKVNIPMPHYSRDDDYIFVWRETVVPIVENLDPKVILISAGFDGFRGEHLTTLRLTERFFRYAGSTLSKYSLTVILEGGYDVGLRKGLPAFIEGHLRGIETEETVHPSYETLKTVEKIIEIQKSNGNFKRKT